MVTKQCNYMSLSYGVYFDVRPGFNPPFVCLLWKTIQTPATSKLETAKTTTSPTTPPITYIKELCVSAVKKAITLHIEVKH